MKSSKEASIGDVLLCEDKNLLEEKNSRDPPEIMMCRSRLLFLDG